MAFRKRLAVCLVANCLVATQERLCLLRFVSYCYILLTKLGTAVAQWLRCWVTNRKVAGSIPGGVSRFFIGMKSFRSHFGPGVDSASNRNEYQELFLGAKAAGA